MQLRRATALDGSALATLRWEFRGVERGRAETDRDDFIERCTIWMRERLAEQRQWSVWIAEHDGHAVGQIWVQLFEKIPNPAPGRERERHAYISNLYVKPSARGGVGTLLLESCLAWLAEQNVDTILLWPSAASRSLYERHGFTATDDVLLRKVHP